MLNLVAGILNLIGCQNHCIDYFRFKVRSLVAIELHENNLKKKSLKIDIWLIQDLKY